MREQGRFLVAEDSNTHEMVFPNPHQSDFALTYQKRIEGNPVAIQCVRHPCLQPYATSPSNSIQALERCVQTMHQLCCFQVAFDTSAGKPQTTLAVFLLLGFPHLTPLPSQFFFSEPS